ncbi:MAG: copper amine oxidase N-terminal domain-containing protein [Syntrophomonas sp.]
MLSEPKAQLPGIILIITLALLVSCFSWSLPAAASGASLVVTTGSASGIDQSTATLNGQITASGSSDITDYGFCYGTDPSCSNKVPVGGSISEGSAYSTQINGLTAGTTYYFMAYAVNSEGTVNGSPVSFATSAAVTPTVATASASGIDQNMATFNGQITTNGGAAISDYGFCWGTDSSCPNKISVGGSISDGSSFSYTINGLATGTTYYYKAYATNSAGPSYGNPESFTTSAAAVTPTVTSDSASGISTTSGTINGTVTAIGSSAVTQYGFIYGTTAACTSQIVIGNTISQGSSFSYQLSGLSASTTYYYKAYATNAAGTSYGSLTYFTTTASSTSTLTVETDNAFDIESDSATLNGYVSTVGDYSITQYGFYYGTTSSCISQLIVGYSADAGDSFYYELSGLNEYTTYYFRAYATNNAGTSYGNIYSFTTNSGSKPDVATNTPSVSEDYAYLYGHLTSKGGSDIESYGFYYGTSSSPSTRVVVASDDIDTYDTFSYTLSGLDYGTIYYFKAYATNSDGTSYGSVLSFMTPDIAIEKPVTTTTTQEQKSSVPVCVFTIDSSGYSMNGISVSSDVAPYIKDNRTFLPLYTAANALGISTSNISWDGASGTVTIIDGSRIVVLTIGSQQIWVNSVPIHLEVAPEISHGRTCLPVGLISQLFGATCTWNGASQTVTIQQSA